MEEAKIDILGMSEVKRNYEKIYQTKNNYNFFHIGNNLVGQRVWEVDPKLKNNFLEMRGISDKLAIKIF